MVGAEAERAERTVAAHCHGKAGILAALRAGCRTIEHASVTIAAGTDLGLITLDGALSWGRNGTEPAHLVAAGLSTREAIDACTAHAPLTLGPQARHRAGC
ncbi:hypothetical protein AB0I10_24935 [Streptomyces sp. NPDC050636]|uniref:hypothetical protein n=1 Tax=Streptomyces sp. NPDC050636 TaxID=3154510 RepID=UPI0034165052